MSNEENIIIRRIRSGETREFGLLVNRHGPALMAFVGRIVEQQEDAGQRICPVGSSMLIKNKVLPVCT